MFLPRNGRKAAADSNVPAVAFLRSNTTGTIEIVYPSLLESQVGVSLDGVFFSADGGFQCTGACSSATPIARNQDSGPFAPTGSR